ncbi:hypothetical protein BC938DRAFT_476920 [Jimgerdemannia flammicorona]|uniref:Uncharacterized protein n=1 Tax=Jimgerdemannia flammicorona TaxID=994334 RepID=A0A433QPY8_9FUNG|nr:hypothetical protein BC938DRAFT_476920 [Jimgerdemannia flammicorona]
MDMDSALSLLLRTEDVLNSGENAESRAIIKELDHLPLAIDLAGAYMQKVPMTPTKFLENYKRSQKTYLDLKNVIKATGNKYAHTVLTVWKMSFDRVQDPLAINVLRAL